MNAPDRRTAERRVSPAVGEFAITECARLRAVNAGLVKALQRCLTHFENIRAQQVDRDYDSPMMAQARAAIAATHKDEMIYDTDPQASAE